MNKTEALELAIKSLENEHGMFYDNWYRAKISVEAGFQSDLSYMEAQEKKMKKLLCAIEILKVIER